ncbi:MULTISPECIES: NifU family protein [Nonlabens]|uniref:Fe-S cluster biogenesis protein NfuA n=1 Tax=Nonlabens ulvanivorans TaxID=906888 RepID=A0A081DCU6_NONUL|nr:NifU family protein [Nonlabens ulvanivorans]PRX15616.1 Fe-S cluster biogenesis protein NfuA [Nonlabens ulvanivorans]GAK76742.1 nitrogen-fixing NifU [Nonlabens ulvanivorans]GAL00115.1 nitrogen-fixing NifU [Nonlabens ulvanivorans]GAL73526.1 nitrogen-fixing NifU C-terminal [Nonlabens ulvanivorans]
MTGTELKAAVEAGLEEIRPFLQRDAGDIELVDIKDDKYVTVRLLGTCVGCHVNQMTLKSGVELTVKKHAPQIESVIDISGQDLKEEYRDNIEL